MIQNDNIVPNKINTEGIKNNTQTNNHNNDDAEVMTWLDEIGLGQHAGKFIVNGYHSLGMIRNIDSHRQLIEIGLNSIQDRNRIMYWIMNVKQNKHEIVMDKNENDNRNDVDNESYHSSN
eukprot:146347_1